MLQYAGETERMNLCQALTSAMDITMEKDSSAGEIVCSVTGRLMLTGRSKAALATEQSASVANGYSTCLDSRRTRAQILDWPSI